MYKLFGRYDRNVYAMPDEKEILAPLLVKRGRLFTIREGMWRTYKEALSNMTKSADFDRLY
jgi:hypothetical protein